MICREYTILGSGGLLDIACLTIFPLPDFGGVGKLISVRKQYSSYIMIGRSGSVQPRPEDLVS